MRVADITLPRPTSSFTMSLPDFVFTSMMRVTAELVADFESTLKLDAFFLTTSIACFSAAESFNFKIKSCGAENAGTRFKSTIQIVTNTAISTPSEKRPAPQMIPVPIDQNRKSKSIGSLMAVLNLTIERAPTIPREITRFDCIAKMMPAVISEMIAIEIA